MGLDVLGRKGRVSLVFFGFFRRLAGAALAVIGGLPAQAGFRLAGQFATVEVQRPAGKNDTYSP